MRWIGYGLGRAVLLVAAATLVAQLLSLAAAGGYRPISLAAIWRAIHDGSLASFQALVEGSVGPALWMPIQLMLSLPAWLVLGVFGGLLLLSCRPRQRGLGGL